MAETNYYTEEGLANIRKELERLLTVERPSISKAISDARDQGDLSENAEYDAAKEAQGMLEIKIAKIQETIRNARVVDASKLDVTKVLIFSTVIIKNLKNGALCTYTLVPESEADLKLGKISVTSPIAKGLLGKKPGDKAEISVPAGKLEFEIIEIKK